MSEPSPFLRQWILLRQIAAADGAATVKYLADQTGVCDKTIRRDLDLLREAGFPITENVGEFGRKAFAIGVEVIPTLCFTYDEALALFFCRRAVNSMEGTFFWESAQQAFNKIQATLGPRVADYVEQTITRFHQRTSNGNYADRGPIINDLLIGIEDSRAIEITYHSSSSTEPTTYEVHPYGLVENHGSLYLIGYSLQHLEIRNWKVDRIQEAERTRRKFVRPTDFSLDNYLAGSVGVFHGYDQVTVRVRFVPSAARYATERQMHASQQAEALRDGSTIVTWQLSSTREIRGYILSFGAAAEVLEPASLREDIRSEGERLRQLYESPASPSNNTSTPTST
ncbi:MAG: helix-turn-helix transcriptional regulator [Planctomycetota bacterium]